MDCYWYLLCNNPRAFWRSVLSQLNLGIVTDTAEKINLGFEHVTYGLFVAKGRRQFMEDYAEVRALTGNESEKRNSLVWLAVYDGHGGDSVAKFCSENMFRMFVDTLEARVGTTKRTYRPEDIVAALQKTYVDVDAALAGDEVSSKNDGFEYPLRTGSTSTTVVVTDTHIVFAHIGDSQAVLVRKGKIQYVTRAHTATEKDEKERIQATSAKIKRVGAEWHVRDSKEKRSLGMTRAFGNFHFKIDKKLSKEKQAVICTPEIKVVERAPEDESIFIASDGLWDVRRPETLPEETGSMLDDSEDVVSEMRKTVHALGVKAHMDGSNDNVSIIWLDLTKS